MKRFLFSIGAVLWALLLAYLFWTAKQIELQSNIDEAQAADAIIILGAAEYHGTPSPVLQARLNHGLTLYLKRLAPYIITTGGAGGDARFTEAEVGRAYLSKHDVPSEMILVEDKGSTTGQSLAEVNEIMRRMGFRTCIVVSDGYHIFRAKRILEDDGVKVYGSPRPGRGVTSDSEMRWLYLKQAIAYLLFRVGINI
jgi:uncharacterized SAM-binding protein YcdF (DUF218 family)